MKTLFALLLLTASSARATLLALVMIKQPIYLHESDNDAKIQIIDVPVAIVIGIPESSFGAIGTPFIPITNGSWKTPHDINLASLYKIRVSADAEKAGEFNVIIDASKAKVPEGYPFTLEQVIDAVSTCVKLMHPTEPESVRKFNLKIIRPEAK